MTKETNKDILTRLDKRQAIMEAKLDSLFTQLRGHLARHWAVELAVVMLAAGGLLKVFVWG